MTSTVPRVVALVVALAGAAASWTPATACGLEGGPGDAFAAAHPSSLRVAFAARDALHAGLLAPDPALEGALAHDRADDRLRALAAALPLTATAGSVVVLLIETGVWTRLTPHAGVWVPTEHVSGPRADEATLVATELALRDLAAGRLRASEAMASGLLWADRHEPLIAALMRAYPDARRPSLAQR